MTGGCDILFQDWVQMLVRPCSMHCKASSYSSLWLSTLIAFNKRRFQIPLVISIYKWLRHFEMRAFPD
jgi:hypothetical protein